MSRKAKDRAALEERIGYKFADKALLERAVTHISALAGGATRANSYQRLEFLGDHVLGLVISDMLYRAFPKANEGEPARQLALIGFRECAIEHVGNDQAEHVIAEEFQALVAVGAGGAARKRGNMRDRTLQQRLIGELVADPLLERRSVLGLAAHRTIVNSLLQRTATGQRQNCQARSPS